MALWLEGLLMVDLEIDFSKGVVKFDMATALAEVMKEATLEVLDETADYMVHVAKELVRVDTGTLQKTIRKERTGDIIRVRAGGFYVNPKTHKKCDYALIIELQYPYMKPAWEMAKIGLEEKIKQRAIDKVRSKFG